jgi:antitoxin ParD1/3/4
MNITLPKELEKLINEQIELGLFDSPGEVIREGLRLLREQNQLREIRREELRREIQKGIDDIREGRFTTYTTENIHELADEIKNEARAEMQKKQEQNS